MYPRFFTVSSIGGPSIQRPRIRWSASSQEACIVPTLFSVSFLQFFWKNKRFRQISIISLGRYLFLQRGGETNIS